MALFMVAFRGKPGFLLSPKEPRNKKKPMKSKKIKLYNLLRTGIAIITLGSGKPIRVFNMQAHSSRLIPSYTNSFTETLL